MCPFQREFLFLLLLRRPHIPLLQRSDAVLSRADVPVLSHDLGLFAILRIHFVIRAESETLDIPGTQTRIAVWLCCFASDEQTDVGSVQSPRPFLDVPLGSIYLEDDLVIRVGLLHGVDEHDDLILELCVVPVPIPYFYRTRGTISPATPSAVVGKGDRGTRSAAPAPRR